MEAFDQDRERIIAEGIKEGLKYILTVGTEMAYFEKVLDIIEIYPHIYGAIGIHPHNSKDYNEGVSEVVDNYLKERGIVACGEIGLDFFKDYSPRDSQIEAFKGQIMAAHKAGLPIVVHSRNAVDKTLEILENMKGFIVGGVMHCYSYDLPTAKRLLDMGFYISIAGPITYKNTKVLADVVRYVPVERLLSETDAPFLTPHPWRGRRNLPHFVKYTVKEMARIKGMDISAMANAIHENFLRLFPKVSKGGSR
jgi:TatD DNase family protein